MPLTNNQITTLRAAVLASGVAAPLLAAGDSLGVQAWLNSSSGQMRWREQTPVVDVEEAPSYTGYDSLTQGARDSWLLFLARSRDFGKLKVRAWVIDIWGAASSGNNTDKIFQAAVVDATNAQAALPFTQKNVANSVTAIDCVYQELVSEQEANRIVFRNNGQVWS